MNNKRFWIMLTLLLGLSALLAAPAQAATIAVANGAVAISDNGVCSLIEAIENANDTTAGLVHDDCAAGDPAGADTITLPTNGVFTLTSAMPFQEDGLPYIYSEITVDGNGSIIERDPFGAALFRMANVQTGDLTLNDLTIRYFDIDEAGAGAIMNFGVLTVNRVTFDDNEAEGGGAISNHGEATITDSTFTSNSGEVGIAAGVGGAIWNSDDMTITGSYFEGNFASTLAGAIHNNGTLNMMNSTVYNNNTTGTGGGINNNGAVTLTNVTVTGNSGTGGGIRNQTGATLTLARSLITYNFASGSPNNITNSGTVVADAYNLIGHSSAASVSGFTPGATDFSPSEHRNDILSTTPVLNGGPTLNFALVADSPAIDAAPSADCAAPPVDVDQRGLPRAVDGDGGASTDECDVGAHEAQGVPVNPLLYVSPLTAGSAGGVAVTPQDIVAQDLSDDSWAMYFDGSDVGVVKTLSAFTFLPDGDILMSFKANQVIAGVGTFTPWDVARFTPSSLGTTTAGTFTWYVDGSDVGLTTSAEKIDALDVLADGRVLVSTAGTLAVPKVGGGTLKSQDEDLTALTLTSVGATTTGTWALYFNGTAITGLGAEDVAGAHVDEATGDLYLSILGAFKVGGISGNGKDVLLLTESGGSYTVTGLFWRGAENGFNLNLGGIEMD